MVWYERLACWWLSLRPRRTLGQRGERAARNYLKHRGYRIVAEGERDRIGELDLVAVDGRTLVFVEVKTRSSLDGGHPEEAVDREKQRRLIRAALSFIQRHDLFDSPARFDVIAVCWPDGQRSPDIAHIPAAFDASGLREAFS